MSERLGGHADVTRRTMLAIACAALSTGGRAAFERRTRRTGENIVHVEHGALRGVAGPDGATVAFKGIPFAAPPVGPLRWRPPQPGARWTGIRNADRFGPVCPQPVLPRDAFMAQFSFADPPECPMAEDCLYLNIWAPRDAAGAKLPVMVWVYGGGHRLGGGSHPATWGASLAAKGVVLVTLNYRLGSLGYLSHPALTAETGHSGNYAAMDIVAALKWVQRNIAKFGGDPACVTLFGQSAGAVHVNALLAAPAARGLFHRAIAQSGGHMHGGMLGAPMLSAADADRKGAELLGAVTLEQMRRIPADQLLSLPARWDLVIDGALLRDDIQQTFERGEQHPVPLIAGMNAQEGSIYPLPGIGTRDAFVAAARGTYGGRADAFLDLYPTRSDADARLWQHVLARDTGFGYQAYKLAQLHSRRAATFAYFFDHPVPLPATMHFREPPPPGGYGAYHGAEIYYVFDNLAQKPFEWTVADHALAARMSNRWATFARTGNPNEPGQASWKRHVAAAGNALHIGQHDTDAAFPNLAALRFFDEEYNPAKKAAAV